MIANNFIDKDLLPLSGQESVKEVNAIFKIQDVNDLPVLEGNKLLGIITEKDLVLHDDDEKINKIPIQVFESIGPHNHFFEIWSRMLENRLSCIPVVNEHDEFLGCIRQKTLLQFYKQSFALTEPGSIVVLSQRKVDYSLRKIAAIVEDEDCIILSSFVTETSDAITVLVTIKLNCQDAQGVLNSFTRHGIEIVDIFSEETFNDFFKERFNLLMNYLNL